MYPQGVQSPLQVRLQRVRLPLAQQQVLLQPELQPEQAVQRVRLPLAQQLVLLQPELEPLLAVQRVPSPPLPE